MAKAKPIILVDMDGVVADFERGFIEKWRAKYPDRPYIEIEERSTFYATGDYPAKWWPHLWKIMNTAGFFADLPPIEGSIKAVKQMARSGYQVYFCSAPLIQNPYCASEKYSWIKQHFGRKWVGQLILALDKTMVRGDFLIDDRPEIKGKHTPSWEHILYEHPFNRNTNDLRRLTWANWRDVIGKPS